MDVRGNILEDSILKDKVKVDVQKCRIYVL